MKFYEFLESRLVENADESGFIRTFFQTFRDFDDYDKTALLVFADWLDDHDDPRAKLVRRAESLPNLRNEATRAWLAGRLGLAQYAIQVGTGGDEFGQARHWDLSSTLDPDIFLMLGTEHGPKWASRSVPNSVLNLSQIPNEVLAQFFWNLMGYGWNLH